MKGHLPQRLILIQNFLKPVLPLLIVGEEPGDPVEKSEQIRAGFGIQEIAGRVQPGVGRRPDTEKGTDSR